MIKWLKWVVITTAGLILALLSAIGFLHVFVAILKNPEAFTTPEVKDFGITFLIISTILATIFYFIERKDRS